MTLPTDQFLQQIQDAVKESHPKSTDPRDWVFEFVASVPVEGMYIMNRKLFDDGRLRVALNLQYQPVIEEWLASLPNES